MNISLKEMSLEELWRLFPIELVPFDSRWELWYAEEASLLRRLIPQVLRISHIGSTAVEGLVAKPIVDVLVELPETCDLSAAAAVLEDNGYITMNRSPSRISLNKGYTPSGFAERVFHIHLRIAGDNDELYFRDYLRVHPDVALGYEALKLSLWREFEHDRDGYTNAKSGFVEKHTAAAKTEFGERY